MRLHELKGRLADTRDELKQIYRDTRAALSRFERLRDGFAERYGAERDIVLLSVPGRSEICGNHTDHNHGVAIAASIDRDIIAIASARDDGVIRLQSEGRSEDIMTVEKTVRCENFPRYKCCGLIAGVVNGFVRAGYKVGGFDAYTMTDVLSGSGLSSSAAFEVMVGNILNHLYNGGRIDNKELAKIAQYAENEYFGKPCGLMDQMACAVGGFVYMDFKEPGSAIVEPIDFSLTDAGYRLCIVATGGSHSELNEEYASIPREMRAVAAELGCEVLAEISESDIIAAAPRLRENVGDRAILRALHFVRECERVRGLKSSLLRGDVSGLLAAVRLSGHSSFEYLQNVYTNRNVSEQGLSLALALTEKYISESSAACRVHGGGFAGTVQAIMPEEMTSEYISLMDGVFGKGAVMVLEVRPRGAIRIL